MRRIIPLWTGAIPHSEGFPEQIPAIKEFAVSGSKSAMLVCPGGAYLRKAAHEGDPVAEMINEIGVSAYVLDYRVLPCSRYAPLSDAIRAIRLIRSMGYARVGIMGFSAGGHLSAMTATANAEANPDSDDPIERVSGKCDAAGLCYAPIDLIHFYPNGARRLLLGPLADDEAARAEFSPYLHVDSNTPPVFIWHTADDEVVNVGHAYAMARALTDQGVKMEMHVFPQGRHGLGLAEDAPDVHQWCGLFQNWLKRNQF